MAISDADIVSFGRSLDGINSGVSLTLYSFEARLGSRRSVPSRTDSALKQ